jgi:predicted Rossmann fold nucleotide-binding protein DprA/Smf involved in DNA uptake
MRAHCLRTRSTRRMWRRWERMHPRRCGRWADVGVLRQPTLALVSSVRVPGDAIIAMYDLARNLRDAGVTVVGGFHSPMEQECLRLLLRGTQGVVVCPARGVEKMRVPAAWRDGIASGRLLVVSPFGAHERRATTALAGRRNQFVAAIAREVLVAYAAPGSKTEALGCALLRQGRTVYTLAVGANAALVAAGARTVGVDHWNVERRT